MDERDTKRFLKALETLVEIGSDLAPEIEEELRPTSPEEIADFVLLAARAGGILGVMVGNLLCADGARILLPARVEAGVTP